MSEKELDLSMSKSDLRALVNKTPPSGKKRKVGFIAFVATLGSFLFGYDTGVMSGALPYMQMPYGADGFMLSAYQEGAVGALLTFGAAFGALIGGRLSDRYGRRHNIIMLAIIFIIGALGNTFAPNIWVLYPFRIVLGFAVGGASATVPVYLAETAPKRIRGTIVAIDQLMIVVGQLLAFTSNSIINALYGGPHMSVKNDPTGTLSAGKHSWEEVIKLSGEHGGNMDHHHWYELISTMSISGGNGSAWRIMLFLCTLPAIALWIGMRMMPESSRWYVQNQRYYEAVGALQRVREPGKDEPIADEMEEMLNAVRTQRDMPKGTFKEIMQTKWLRKLFFIGVFLAICNQTTGVNTVMYYAPKVLQFAGMGVSASITAQVANGVLSVVGSALGLWLVFRFTRRQVLISCIVGVALTLALIAGAFAFTISPAMDAGKVPPAWAPLLVLALMGLFMLIVQSSNGPVVWTMLGEMFPARVRGIANGSAVFCMWMTNAFITYTFPKMMEALGGSMTYAIYALLNAAIALALWKVMPETSKHSLEELEAMFEQKYS